jgi:hypothetical protein
MKLEIDNEDFEKLIKVYEALSLNYQNKEPNGFMYVTGMEFRNFLMKVQSDNNYISRRDTKWTNEDTWENTDTAQDYWKALQ